MNPLLAALRGCFHQAAQICSCPVGRLIQGFGLQDFLTNSVQTGDDAPTLAVKALAYFCEGARPVDTRFQVAVLAVTVFLNRHHANPPRRDIPQQAASDLVSILRTHGVDEAQVRQWVTSHFG
jgi:hypothetical protein